MTALPARQRSIAERHGKQGGSGRSECVAEPFRNRAPIGNIDGSELAENFNEGKLFDRRPADQAAIVVKRKGQCA